MGELSQMCFMFSTTTQGKIDNRKYNFILRTLPASNAIETEMLQRKLVKQIWEIKIRKLWFLTEQKF